MKKLAAISTAAVFLVASSAAMAGGGKECGKHHGKNGHGKFMRLEFKQLPKEKKAQLRQIRKETMTKAMPLIKQLQAAKIDLRAQLIKPGANFSTVKPTVDKINQLKAQLMNLKVQSALKAYQVTGILMPLRR